jgi:hypothetical protein
MTALGENNLFCRGEYMEDMTLREGSLATRIYFVRGEKVMVDFDLAMLYGVDTAQLKRAVRRNIERFPV